MASDPLAAFAAARLADLWETTLGLLERGKAEDEAGAIEAAVLLYAEAISGIEALLEVEPKGRRKELLTARLAEYGARLTELQGVMLRRAAAAGALAKSAAAAASPAKRHSQAEATAPEAAGSVAAAGANDGSMSNRSAQTWQDSRHALHIESVSAARPSAAALASARLQTEMAVQADEAADVAEALELYTSAAEHMLTALRLEDKPNVAALIRERLEAVMHRAEQLKAGGKNAPLTQCKAPSPMMAGSATVQVLAAPAKSARAVASEVAGAATSLLSESEKKVLARSSRMGKLLHYPWLGGDHVRERFAYPTPWEDPDGLLALNTEQRLHFGRWGRPSEYMRGEPTMIYLVSPLTITQTIITDCSFVSSLVIAAAYERRFRRKLITAIIHPQDRNGTPIYNPSGKYLVRLKFNGVSRRILIDDRLPLDRRGRPMVSHSSHAEELWVSLIEKAFMKVNGGYDFPGSNSGIDMHALTGWIPEQFRTDDADFRRERLWERMTSASKYGDCLVTVATGEMNEAQAEALGLVPTHAYAVLAVRQVSSGERLLQLKNPWARVRWKGAYSADDSARWTPALRRELGFDRQGALVQDNGIFWIDYNSVLRYFNGVFLNWNPALFRHHTLTHGQWPPRSDFRDDRLSIGTNPQYVLSVNTPSSGTTTAVWLLLTRHHAVPYNEVNRESAERDPSKDAFLTVHVFNGSEGGKRAYYLERCWIQGVYTNRPHTLVKFDLPPSQNPHVLTLALAQYKATDVQVDYTFDVYAQSHFSLRPMPPAAAPSACMTGTWRGVTAGGSPNHDTHVDNPRFMLDLPFACEGIALELECIGTKATAAGGKRVIEPPEVEVGLTVQSASTSDRGSPSNNLSLHSGDYRSGYCRLEAAAMPAGKYYVIPSTFEPGMECSFEVRAAASRCVRCVLTPAPNEAHGLSRQLIRGEWNAVTGVGSPNHGAFWRNPQLRFTVSRRAEVLLRLRVPRVDRKTAPSLCVALFDGAERLDSSTGRSLSRARAVSEGGVFAYPPGGVCLPRMWLDKGTYICVVSTFNPFVGPWELVLNASEGALRIEKFR